MQLHQLVFRSLIITPLIATGEVQASSINITSGVTPGIRALGATTHTTYYGYGTGCYEFATFTAADFASAVAAPAAWILSTPLPGAWNNSGNLGTGSPWTGANSASLNANHARWIHNSTDTSNGGGNSEGVSVLYAIPFTATTSVVNITIDFVTDNGLGNTNGGGGHVGHTDYQNDGLFLNGSSLGYSSPGGIGMPGQPAQFSDITKLTFNNRSVPIGANFLYFYQFNWGGPGGSAFNINIEMVPLPPAGWAGISTLVGAFGLGCLRRRRLIAQ